MKRKVFGFTISWVVMCVAVPSVEAQQAVKVKEFKPGKIEKVSVDRLGNFFLVFTNGAIRKYDPQGKVLAALPAKPDHKTPDLIEPWFHPSVFVFRKDNHQLITYDRNLELSDEVRLDPSIAISPSLVCPTNDNKLLVFDEADYSVKKVKPFTHQIITEFDIDTTQSAKPDFIFMREYQNLIFMQDKNSGIFIYSNVGKLVNQIRTASGNFGFFGEELFYLQDDKIVFYDLYTEKTREIKCPSAIFAIVTDERILTVMKNGKVILYEFSDQKFPVELR
ncbi:MAG: hypothetical protein JSS79_15010 [Bacteroidetes bacterium]|nr:hypothetical protein [Bacteroidota bacterium]